MKIKGCDTMRIVSKNWYNLTNEWSSQEDYLKNQSNEPTCIFCGTIINLHTDIPIEDWYSHFNQKHYIFQTDKAYITKVRCWWPH